MPLALALVPVSALVFAWAVAVDVPLGSPTQPFLSSEVFGEAGLWLLRTTGLAVAAFLMAAFGTRVRLFPASGRFLGLDGPYRPAVPVVTAAAALAGASALLLASGVHRVAERRLGSDPGLGLLPLAVEAVLCAVLFAQPVRQWWLGLLMPRTTREKRRAAQASQQALQDKVVPQLEEELTRRANELVPAEQLTVRGATEAAGLRKARAPKYVRGPAEDELVRISKGMDDGSIALSGRRGAGKTELLEAFCNGRCDEAPIGLGLVIPAPVAFNRTEFMLHLFDRLCHRVREAQVTRTLRKDAADHLQLITHQLSTAHDAGGDISLFGVNVTVSRSRQSTRLPLTYPEIVGRLRDFLQAVAGHLDASAQGRLVIGIDELDRIQPAARAREFLNELRVILNMPNCLFVLSVSDETLHEAELTVAGGGDVFDSVIDEVVRVEPLRFHAAVALLESRVIGLPRAFTALFNCLAGGVPRDLLRIARSGVLFVPSQENETLAATARRLVGRELERITSRASVGSGVPDPVLDLLNSDEVEADHPGLAGLAERVAGCVPDGDAGGAARLALRLVYLDTLLGVFAEARIDQRFQEAAEDGDAPHTFGALTQAGQLIGVADGRARRRLDEVRRAWGLPAVPWLTE